MEYVVNIIEALRYTGDNLLEILAFARDKSVEEYKKSQEYIELFDVILADVEKNGMIITTASGQRSVIAGDYIVRTDRGTYFITEEEYNTYKPCN